MYKKRQSEWHGRSTITIRQNLYLASVRFQRHHLVILLTEWQSSAYVSLSSLDVDNQPGGKKKKKNAVQFESAYTVRSFFPHNTGRVHSLEEIQSQHVI